MQKIDFPPLGREVSCLGLGCARLDGRVALKRSAKLLETALELGITYFDVAASYGTAEEALGYVIGNSKDVVVTTKVGPPPAPYDETKMRIKHLVKPLLDRARGLKILLRGPQVNQQTAATRPRYDFSAEAIRRSLDRSLERLKRDRADIFLAHEPNRLDLAPEVAERFQTLVDEDRIGAFGVGVDVREDQWAPFGSIWQSGWPSDAVGGYTSDASRIFHGVLRYADQDRMGRTTTPPGELIAQARRACPNALLLVSASTPERLRQLVRAVEEAE